MDCQNLFVLWGRNFIGNWFVALQCKTIHYFVKGSWGCDFMGKGNLRNPQTLVPHKHWWFHSKHFFLSLSLLIEIYRGSANDEFSRGQRSCGAARLVKQGGKRGSQKEEGPAGSEEEGEDHRQNLPNATKLHSRQRRSVWIYRYGLFPDKRDVRNGHQVTREGMTSFDSHVVHMKIVIKKCLRLLPSKTVQNDHSIVYRSYLYPPQTKLGGI